MKKGPPKAAVITPTGNSTGARRILANVSEAMRNEAPMSADVGMRSRWSGPKMRRLPWGTINPTKPINPHTETDAAVISDAKRYEISLSLST
jgi:hypothetical protein